MRKDKWPHVAATPAMILRNAEGRVFPMKAGPCLWCGEWVESGRDAAGATDPYDPCWNVDGDFGCDRSPDADDDGCGDHARPYDLALRMIREAR